MAAFARFIEDDGAKALEGLLPVLEGIQEVLVGKFPSPAIRAEQSEAEKAKAKVAGSSNEIDSKLHEAVFNPTGSAQNKKETSLNDLIPQVRKKVEAALSILLALALWARVETTKIECADKSGGGGDVVELDTANSIERLIGPIEKNLDALPDYFESRAAACDKILVSVKATAGKDRGISGRETLFSDTSSKEWLLHREALNEKWSVHLRHTLLKTRAALVLVGYMIEKKSWNLSKEGLSRKGNKKTSTEQGKASHTKQTHGTGGVKITLPV